MLQQIEEDERRLEEKKRREEEEARAEQQRREEEEERRRVEELEREQERTRLQLVKSDAETRRGLPYGLRVANYGQARSIDEVCRYLPILMRASRSTASSINIHSGNSTNQYKEILKEADMSLTLKSRCCWESKICTKLIPSCPRN